MSRCFELPDLRRLTVHEYGDPHGAACFYLPGTPASGLAGAAYDDAASAAGVRLLAIDRPGYGGSDPHPGRTLLDLADDVVHVADSLALGRFAVMGESGGGPHALAVGSRVPERVSVLLVTSGAGPASERWAVRGMKPANRRLMAVARRAPWALRLPMALTRRALLDPARSQRLVDRQLLHAPAADQRVLTHLAGLLDITASPRDALRVSSRAAAQELSLLARPWGFALSSVTCHVELWHGAEDVNVPSAVAERLAEELPNAVAHVLSDEGHAVGWSRRADLFAAVMRAASGVSS